MRLVVVTGMSGAGKSTALKLLEDVGFFCVDNLPPTLIAKFAEVCSDPRSHVSQVALGVDIRGGELFRALVPELNALDSRYSLEVLFLDSQDDVLLKRYKETRRNHPLARRGSIVNALAKEREMLADIKSMATYTIDTSTLLTRQLKGQLNAIFMGGRAYDNMIINLLSFGYKYGLPADADLVFDVRFIPNPFYIAELSAQSGMDAPVRDFVLSWGETSEFLAKVKGLLEFLIPRYIAEGKNRLVIGIGCTGGRHRSVTLAEELYRFLREAGRAAFIEHRDMRKADEPR